MLMRTAYDKKKKLEKGDFVVLVVGGAKQTLLAGVCNWKGSEEDDLKGVWYYQDGQLTETLVSNSDLMMGVIVGTEKHSFPLRQRIINAIVEGR